MRVLILTPEFSGSGGGIGTFYRALVNEFCARNVSVRVIEGSGVRSERDKARRAYNGAQVETLEHSRLIAWEKQFSAFSAMPALRRHLAAAWAMWEQAGHGKEADIVEAADWGLLFMPPVVEATCPSIVQCHGSMGQIADHDPVSGEEAQNLLVRLIERDVLSAAEAVQTHSRANAEFWSAQTGREVESILPAWSPANEASMPETSDCGLVVGRLQRWKGPHILCEALRRLGTRAPRVEWVGRDTVWGARDSATSAHLARKFPDVWGSKFVYQSQIPASEVVRRQATALFNLVPSTWDVFNFTAVEAMGSGRPTIVSTGAGASELVEDGVNGFLFANEDPDALANAMNQVLSANPHRRAEIGQAGRRTVLDMLDPKAIVAQRLSAYRRAIEKFKSAPPIPLTGWLGSICRPSESLGDDLTFLENIPLRPLAKHVVGRISRRVCAK